MRTEADCSRRSAIRQGASVMIRCDICKTLRRDDQIDVHKIDMHPEQPGTVVRNVKYCNDKPACFEGALKWPEK